jgi:Protein of unknown function (DUF1553)/Protein of unknown function (DUF1549)
VVSTNLALLGALWLGLVDSSNVDLKVDPAKAQLRGSDSLVQIAVTDRSVDGKLSDVTASAKYSSRDPNVARVDSDGLIRPTGDGSTTIEVASGGSVSTVEVIVSDFANSRPVHFVGEVVPIFSKHGCNAGGCHGKSTGQNGFRLSLLGFDPRSDYESLVKEGRGRRVFPPAPEASLLLKKPTTQIPHGGGKKFAIGSPEYNTLARWIGQGMPFGVGKEPALVRLAVEPSQRIIPRKGRQQIRVVAHYGDGTSTDVTRLAQYQSNAAELAEVDPKGVIRALGGVGEAAIMARFGGLVAVARATIPSGVDAPKWDEPASRNLIDPFVFRKLRELGLSPSETCTDAEFARRSSIDVCGLLPKPDEVIAFENDNDPEKRSKWVDRLLARPEYADYFAMKWSAILKNKRGLGDVSQPGTFAFHGWIRQSLAENKPYDKFVAEIVAAKGDPRTNPPVVWYRQASTVEERVDDSAQLFLGIRIQCARCHHHPFERWSQDDYYGFASVFSRIGTKPGADATAPRIYTLPAGMASNPLTGEARKPKPLGGPEWTDLGPHRDPRSALVDWLKLPDNPFFARALVNRYWKHFLGRGLVEPEDDMRVSNPPSNPELLDALADDFVKSGYDLKRLVRTIATSRAYDRSSQPNASNEADRRNFARFYARRLPAEVLLDAVGVVTGSPEKFDSLPQDFRATQLPDDGFASYFLDVFGRPKRESVCECERSTEANLSQTLHLLNSDDVNGKLTPDSARAAKLAADARSESEKVEELYRTALARKPTDEERGECVAFLEKRKAGKLLRQGYEDLIWTLINTKEFLFNQ